MAKATTAPKRTKKAKATTNGETKNRFVGKDLVVKGARQHNLKNVNDTIPK